MTLMNAADLKEINWTRWLGVTDMLANWKKKEKLTANWGKADSKVKEL
jgi:hypothetical protein